MRKKRARPKKGKLSVMPQSTHGLDLRKAILSALEDDAYDWRTVSGLARTVQASENEIVNILDSMPDQIVRASAADGRSLFTTRNHYEKTHGFGDKLLSALADKVVA